MIQIMFVPLFVFIVEIVMKVSNKWITKTVMKEILHIYYLVAHAQTPGGGALPYWRWPWTCRWTGYDFAVINISTGYFVALLRSSILAQGILCPAPPPPPTQYYLGYAYARSLPLKAPPLSPDWQNFWTPLSRAFPALETPLNPKHCSMYPLYFIL